MTRRLVIAACLVASIGGGAGLASAAPTHDQQICVDLSNDPSHHNSQDICVDWTAAPQH